MQKVTLLRAVSLLRSMGSLYWSIAQEPCCHIAGRYDREVQRINMGHSSQLTIFARENHEFFQGVATGIKKIPNLGISLVACDPSTT